MRIYQHVLSLLLFILLTNCSMMEHRNYEELHNHSGNDSYEVATMLSEEYEILQASLNKERGQLIVGGKTNPIKEEERETKRLKISVTGLIIDEGITNAGTLKDGTLKGYDFYSNWVINGDTTKRQYLKPFSDKNYDPKEWLLAFRDIYDEASASYYFNGTFYLKIDNQWNEIDKNFDVENFDYDKHFPDKYTNVRMIELEDQSPAYYVPPEERDSSLIKEIDYESAYSEEIDRGWNSYTYSAGWWYLQVYMPGGDTLRIKRFSDIRNPHMKLYKIPEQYGGRKNVLFIVLEPKNAHFEQVGGMYVVRPRELD